MAHNCQYRSLFLRLYGGCDFGRYHGEDQSLERLMHEVRQIGFPILVKAARGGGGKGMKLAHKERELQARSICICGATTAPYCSHQCPVA